MGFREYLVGIRNDPERRLARRRDGRITHMESGTLIPGPFTFETRREILERLLTLQEQLKRQLVTPEELERIQVIWAEDAMRGIEQVVAAI